MSNKKEWTRGRIILAVTLVVYVAAVIAAAFRFSADRFPSQLAGWVGGAAFVVIIVLIRDARREKKRIAEIPELKEQA